MTFQLERADSHIILRLDGDLIAGSVNEDIISAIEVEIQRGASYAIVNIEKIKYLNSSGIGMLITILTKFRNKGGDLILVNPSEHVKKLLIITKLQNIFIIASSESEALQIIGNNHGKS